MLKLVYAQERLDVEQFWSFVAHMALMYQELEKYGLAFLEMCPRSWVRLKNGELRLNQFHGVINPYCNLVKDDYVNENLPCPEYIKHKTVHFKSNIYGLGYLLYLLTGLKFAFQFYDPRGLKVATMNFHKILPESKMVRTYPEDVSSLVLAMLHKNPEGRPNWGRLDLSR